MRRRNAICRSRLDAPDLASRSGGGGVIPPPNNLPHLNPRPRRQHKAPLKNGDESNPKRPNRVPRPWRLVRTPDDAVARERPPRGGGDLHPPGIPQGPKSEPRRPRIPVQHRGPKGRTLNWIEQREVIAPMIVQNEDEEDAVRAAF